MTSQAHQEFIVNFFRMDVYVVTEWRDGCVFRTKKVGEVAAHSSDPPLRPNSGAMLVPHT